MWKWVRTVIPYERREQRNCQTCHSLLHSKEKTEDSEDGEERGGEGTGGRHRVTETLTHREGERIQETEGKGRGNCEERG